MESGSQRSFLRLFTFKGNGSTHFLNQFLCNRHSQTCSANFVRLPACSCANGSKYVSGTLLSFRFLYPDRQIPSSSFPAVRMEFPHAADIDMSVFSVIFHRIDRIFIIITFHIPWTSIRFRCMISLSPTRSEYSVLRRSVRSQQVLPWKFCSD